MNLGKKVTWKKSPRKSHLGKKSCDFLLGNKVTNVCDGFVCVCVCLCMCVICLCVCVCVSYVCMCVFLCMCVGAYVFPLF